MKRTVGVLDEGEPLHAPLVGLFLEGHARLFDRLRVGGLGLRLIFVGLCCGVYVCGTMVGLLVYGWYCCVRSLERPETHTRLLVWLRFGGLGFFWGFCFIVCVGGGEQGR